MATQIGKSEGAVRHFCTGYRSPKLATRVRLFELFNLPLDGWQAPYADVAPESTPPKRMPVASKSDTTAPPSPGVVSGEGSQGSLLERYRTNAAILESAILKAKDDPLTPSRDIAALSQALNRALSSVGRLTGEAELTEAMILKSAAFVRLLGVVREAATPHPEASRAIAAALSKLGGGGS